MKKLIRKWIQKIVVEIGIQIQKHNNTIARLSLPEFANDPENVLIELPRRIINAKPTSIPGMNGIVINRTYSRVEPKTMN